jgi:hypothetical protein
MYNYWFHFFDPLFYDHQLAGKGKSPEILTSVISFIQKQSI